MMYIGKNETGILQENGGTYRKHRERRGKKETMNHRKHYILERYMGPQWMAQYRAAILHFKFKLSIPEKTKPNILYSANI